MLLSSYVDAFQVSWLRCNFTCNYLIHLKAKYFGSSGIRAGLCRCQLHVCILTINRLRRGEGKLKCFDLEAKCAHERRNMDDDVRNEEELKFCKTFYTMADRVEKLFSRLETLEKAGENALEGRGSANGDDGGDPPPSPFASESSSSSSHHHHKNSRNASKKPFFKLDVKSDLPMYNGESNAENLNNWVR